MHRFNVLLSLISLIIITFSSCEKTAVYDPESEKAIDLKFSVKNLGDDETNTDQEGYGEYNFLGYGYDITGKYYHKSSVKEAIINTPLFVEKNSGRFDISRLLTSSFKTIYATDAEDFTKLLTGETSDIGYFQGSIIQPFPDTEPNSNQYIYGLYDSYTIYKRLSLYAINDQLTPYLSESFKSDSKSLSPAELVEKYGTHVLLSLYMGAKISIDYQGEYRGNDRSEAVVNSFRVGLNECFDLFPGITGPIDSAALKGITNPKVAFEAIGGDPSKITVDESAQTNPTVNTADWKESITEDNARFIYIDGRNNLPPISDFILDASKKQEVETYINEYIKAREVKIN